jgi:hypothetical protein
VPRTTGKSEAYLVLIRNARLTEELSLDWQDFQLVHQETAVRDFYDRVEVEKVYYPEIEALLKEATGAEKIVVFDHQVRNIELSKQGEKDAREYVRTALFTVISPCIYKGRAKPLSCNCPLSCAKTIRRESGDVAGDVAGIGP